MGNLLKTDSAVFTTRIQRLLNGGVRYDIRAKGVPWSKVVLRTASPADRQAAKAEMDAKLKQLKELTGAATTPPVAAPPVAAPPEAITANR